MAGSSMAEMSSVVRVGGARGFVAQADWRRLVITAAHSLPFLPPCDPGGTEDWTYVALLGRFGDKHMVSAECLFVDPIGDIAVLGPPGPLSKDYEALVGAAAPLWIADAPKGITSAWLLSLDGRRFRCTVWHEGRDSRGLWVGDTAEDIVTGMSGSPILKDDGSAIGIVGTGGDPGEKGSRWLSPRLSGNLLGWLLHLMAAPASGGEPRSRDGF